jgi:hypothetical protein
MALICSVTRALLSFITGFFTTLLGKELSSGGALMKIKEQPQAQASAPVRIRRTQLIEVGFPDRPSDICAAAFEKEPDGRLACAIVHEHRKNPGFWKALPYIASELASDPVKRPCETVKWVLMSYAIESRGEVSFEVWEVLISRDDDGSFRASWTEARPEYAKEWIRRVEASMEVVPRISIRPLSAKMRKHRAA